MGTAVNRSGPLASSSDRGKLRRCTWAWTLWILLECCVLFVCARILVEHYRADKKGDCEGYYSPRKPNELTRLPTHLFGRSIFKLRSDAGPSGARGIDFSQPL